MKVDGGGTKKVRSGEVINHDIYYRLVKENFPIAEKIRTACFNCNFGRELLENKICPHKAIK